MSSEREPEHCPVAEWLTPNDFLAHYRIEVEPLRRGPVSLPATPALYAASIPHPLLDQDDLVESKRKALATLDFIASRANMRFMVRRRPDRGELLYGFFDERGSLLVESTTSNSELVKWLKCRIEAASLAAGCSESFPSSRPHRL